MCTAVAILFQENKEHTNSSQQWNGASFLTKKKNKTKSIRKRSPLQVHTETLGQ